MKKSRNKDRVEGEAWKEERQRKDKRKANNQVILSKIVILIKESKKSPKNQDSEEKYAAKREKDTWKKYLCKCKKISK